MRIKYKPKHLIRAIQMALDELDLDETQRISSLLDELDDQEQEGEDTDEKED